jgi:glycosyltransferase involved in cell wall biosynthesis
MVILLLALIIVSLSFAGWIFSTLYFLRVLRLTPRLTEQVHSDTPKVSIILPARNEEGYLERCLASLVTQNYPDMEIIAIDDSSSDNTWKIMTQASSRLVTAVQAPPTPLGWTGKSWASHYGYKNCSGQLLLFTDADTVFQRDLVSIAVAYLNQEDLAALTLIPTVVTEGWLNRLVQPALGFIMAVAFSPLVVNDPKTRWAYFWGSFILIRRNAYEAIGGHERVKGDLVEDRALGRLAKESGCRIRMALGVDRVAATWTRKGTPPWRSLQRVIVPSLGGNLKLSALYSLATMLLLLPPYLVLPFVSMQIIIAGLDLVTSTIILFSFGAIVLMVFTFAFEARKRLRLSALYGLGAPLAAFIVVFSVAASIIRFSLRATVQWKGREYRYRD